MAMHHGMTRGEMTTDRSDDHRDGSVTADAPETPRQLTPAAQRALAEAAERRRLAEAQAARPRELGGRAGPDPVRFGDWEKNGIASDF